MGRASSSKKVARAARAAGRPGAKRSYTWPVAIGAVVIVGVVLVVLSFGGGKSSSLAPRIGDHWHAAFGVYVCDTFAPPLTDLGADEHGIHTHGDGLMHIHPFDSTVAGKKANLTAFAADTGLKVSDTSITVSGVTRKNGDKCGDKVGQVELVTWQSATDTKPVIITKDIASYSPRKDNTVWVLAFVPAGTDVPKPSTVSALANPIDSEATPSSTPTQGSVPVGSTPATSAPAATTTPPTTAKP